MTDKNPRLPSAPTFIDVFAGAGGLSLGLLQAGLRGLFAVEKEPNAFETLRANLIDGTHQWRYAWPDWLPKEPLEIAVFTREYRQQLLALRGSVDVLAGGPPCQGFSPAGQRKRDDPRNRLFEAYVDIARLLKPSILVFENVPWIAIEFGKKARQGRDPRFRGRPAKPFSQRVSEALTDIGYRVFLLLETASNFGVPQSRKRYLILGIREDVAGALDEAVLGSLISKERDALIASLGLPLRKPVTVRQAISDLETSGKLRSQSPDSSGFTQIVYEGPRTAYQRLMHEGLPAKQEPNSLRLPNHRDDTVVRFTQIMRTCRKGVAITTAERAKFGIGKLAITPLHPDRPSKTITSLPDDFLHYSEPRILTVRECARLQSFPDWFEFRGRYTAGGLNRRHLVPRYTQVANAVPPMFARVLGQVLLKLCDTPVPGIGSELVFPDAIAS
jgi:DNA (cytosine-5)-methyltransferase 1